MSFSSLFSISHLLILVVQFIIDELLYTLSVVRGRVDMIIIFSIQVLSRVNDRVLTGISYL